MTLRFQNSLINHLKDKEYAHEYLAVALEAYEEDRNIEALLQAIRDVIKAQQSFYNLSQKTTIKRVNLQSLLEKVTPKNIHKET